MSEKTEELVGEFYKAGLSHVREAVISEHFMHKVNHSEDFVGLSTGCFLQKALSISSTELWETLLPLLKESSDRFAVQRAEATKARAAKNYQLFNLSHENEISSAEVIAEVMYDRQFSRATNETVPRAALAKRIGLLLELGEPIQLVIPALPYKCGTPLKCRGRNPDLSEVGFLLFLFEIAKTVDLLYRSSVPGRDRCMAHVTVISDGRRFNDFLFEPEEHIFRYQEILKEWISVLAIADYVKIEDYKRVLESRLPAALFTRKAAIRKDVYVRYVEIMSPLLDTDDMESSLLRAIEHEPDPETFYAEGRFVPLFKSLIYTINNETLARYAARRGANLEESYAQLTKHIFAPFAELTEEDAAEIETFLSDPNAHSEVSEEKVFEYLRKRMLAETWDATIHYLAEIRSDRDLEADPISACFPKAIRWTIHAKPGQFAIQSNPACGIQVQPWHGAAVFKEASTGGIKLCALPSVMAEGTGSIPVLSGERHAGASMEAQPLFYIHPTVPFETLEDFYSTLSARFTRKRR